MSWADLSDVKCYYELVGDAPASRETVLLIPGLGSTCRVWDDVSSELSREFLLLRPESRNIGASVGKRTPRTIRHFSTDLVELLDYLQLESVHVVGLSLGGIIAQQLAMDHPQRVQRLVLISCGHRFGPYLREIARFMVQSLRHSSWEQYVRSLEMLASGPEFVDAHPDRFEACVREKIASRVSRSAVIDQLRCLRRGGIESSVYEIRCPTLVIAGQYDALIPNCYARQMADEIPGSEFVVIPGCGHNPLWECPGKVLPHIIGFLKGKHAKQDRDETPPVWRRACESAGDEVVPA